MSAPIILIKRAIAEVPERCIPSTRICMIISYDVFNVFRGDVCGDERK